MSNTHIKWLKTYFKPDLYNYKHYIVANNNNTSFISNHNITLNFLHLYNLAKIKKLTNLTYCIKQLKNCLNNIIDRIGKIIKNRIYLIKLTEIEMNLNKRSANMVMKLFKLAKEGNREKFITEIENSQILSKFSNLNGYESSLLIYSFHKLKLQ